MSTNTRRRTLTAAEGTARSSRPEKGRRMASLEPAMDDLEPGIFSDEYDLYPHILEDVQRALKLKVRREARLQAIHVSGSSFSSSSSPGPKAPVMASRIAKPSLESELDFSPSVGIDSLHPVPTSSDYGATLDWAGSVSEEDKTDRRWTLSLAKRKSKDKPPILVSKESLERQQMTFAATIRASMKPQTLKKAAITSDQFRRRYAQLYASLDSTSVTLDPVKVVQWYTKLDPLVQSSLDQAEPLTWQKHLRSKHVVRGAPRFPWHLSALLVDEYVKMQSRRGTMETIPEDILLTSPSFRGTSPSETPSFFTHGDIPSHYHLEASLSRRRSYDGHVSFEPLVESGRQSIGDESRRSVDGITRPWKQSASGPADSPRSSVYSSIFSGSNHSQNPGAASPASSGRHLRDLATRVRRRTNAYESDEASSSHHSVSDDNSRSEDGGRKNRKHRHYFRPPQLDLVSRTQPDADFKGPNDEMLPHEWQDTARTPGQEWVKTPATEELQTAKTVRDSLSGFARQDTASTAVPKTPMRILHLRGLRTSLPSSRRPSFSDNARSMQLDVDDESEQREYDRRAQLLEEAVAQNQRNRYLLQRIAAGVKEYESVQSRMSRALGLEYSPLPHDLIDAFSHDPAVVTGSTRYLKGWRAVENIHEHILEQTETVQSFIRTAKPVDNSTQGSVLETPIRSLLQSMDALEGHRSSITTKTQEVSEALARVKKLHASVKAEYNAAMAHTSSVYPELSHIVALEESFKDRYQQLWEFGMDALTFILDTVTPFWRNYGKVIGVDAQDFLIIPWYRNEFTGEPSRYTIKALPKRSFRHWVMLILLFCGTLAVLILQGRAASSFCSYYRLPLLASPGLWWLTIPFFGIVVLIQFTAVVVETCIVAAQIGVVLWWIGWWAGVFD
ncbi:hypothetical protein BV25DRAFT_1793524 [Artomyces pyxidatus]|uniref:Uncharacterized protein n=1 Tax=Artomyces pyxidatus TaxID=48021 RepID=A0ACB8TI62_9AGAM|nr:hypothetical protein BV25DRAFT_1793524 [Artomyces pyxidatus]